MVDGQSDAHGAGRQQRRLRLPYREQASGMARCALAMFALGAVALFLGDAGLIVAIITAVFAGALAAMAGLVRLMNRSWQKQLQRIEAGHYRLHWRFDDATWTRYRAQFARKQDRALWILPMAISVSGLVVGFLAHDDGSLFWGSVLWTYVATIGAGATVGLVLALGIRWLGRTSERLMARFPGECFVGEHGLYITGQYWPWRSFGQRLARIALIEGDPPELHFTFTVDAGRRRTSRIVQVPVPAGEAGAAEAVVAEFGTGTLSPSEAATSSS